MLRAMWRWRRASPPSLAAMRRASLATCRACSSAPDRALKDRVRLPESSRSWSTETITTIRSRTRFAARSTGTSCWIAPLLTNPSWRPEQRKVVGNLRSMIARYEETRELRLMGGYTAGADPILDKAIKSTPRIYEAMNQTMDAPRCEDPFIDLAAALRGDAKTLES